MRFNVSDLKVLASKLSQAVEDSKLNPKSGWVELEADLDGVIFKVSNLDYYLEAKLKADLVSDNNDTFHATVLANTFIPLVSKLEEDFVDITEELNSLILRTEKSSYNFPIIKELGVTKALDKISFKATSNTIKIDGNDLASVAVINTKNIAGSITVKDYQQYIYVDNIGGITFTENTYVNNFKTPIDDTFKFLLTVNQAQLLTIFKGTDNLNLEIEQKPTFSDLGSTNTNKVKLYNDNITLIIITQEQNIVDQFPSIRLRALAENNLETHVIIDRKTLDKALSRLMIFDKKFDILVLDYSKIVFKENELELVSVKNKNFEIIPYVSSQNVVEKTSIIRFADLVKQLKVCNSKEVDISYNQRPVLIINNGDVKQIIPECIIADKKV